MKKRIAGIALAAICIASLLCVPALAVPVTIPDDATVVNVLGGWNSVTLYGNSVPKNGDTFTNLSCSHGFTMEYQYPTDNHSNEQYNRLMFYNMNQGLNFNGYIYFQFSMIAKDIAGNYLNTGIPEVLMGMFGHYDPSTDKYSGIYISDPEQRYIMATTKQDAIGRYTITVGLDCNQYAENDALGCVFSIPHGQAIVIQLALPSLIVKSGSPLPNADRVLTDINQGIKDINGSINGVNTTLGSFMEQEAAAGREVSMKLSDLDTAIQAQKDQAHNDAQAGQQQAHQDAQQAHNDAQAGQQQAHQDAQQAHNDAQAGQQQAHEDAEQAHQDQKDTQDIILNQENHEIEFILDKTKDDKVFEEHINDLIPEYDHSVIFGVLEDIVTGLSTTETTTKFHIPAVKVPSISSSYDEFTIIEEQDIDFSGFLNNDKIQLLINISKGLYSLFFVFYAMNFVIYIWEVTTFGTLHPNKFVDDQISDVREANKPKKLDPDIPREWNGTKW